MWILIFASLHGQTFYGTKFATHLECVEKGKQTTQKFNNVMFYCKRKGVQHEV